MLVVGIFLSSKPNFFIIFQIVLIVLTLGLNKIQYSFLTSELITIFPLGVFTCF